MPSTVVVTTVIRNSRMCSHHRFWNRRKGGKRGG
jgi:hypothetical protein